jgi:putative acyl-CoA dehydrogenase
MATTDRAHAGATHEVLNQPPPFVDYNAFEADPALGEALLREGGDWGVDRVRDFGAVTASAEALEHSKRAQRNIPLLKTHDRYGHRVDEIDYDPSMHWMLRLGVERELNSLPWREPRAGAHVGSGGDVPPLQSARHGAVLSDLDQLRRRADDAPGRARAT